LPLFAIAALDRFHSNQCIMKLIFMGTPEFARKILVCLIQSKHEVLAVVTGRDEPLPRGNKTSPTPVRVEAERYNIPVLTPKSLKSQKLYDSLQAFDADIFVVAAFKILPRKLFTLPKLGSINIHGSLLPAYRGAAPINWAIINGEKVTGLTSFVLNEKVDTGDMILQEKMTIGEDENFDSLYSRLADIAGPFTLKSLDLLEDDNFTSIKQDHGEASPAPKITSENAMIDFGFPAENVMNFVRGLATVPGAYTFHKEKRVKIFECRVIKDSDGIDIIKDTKPGTILSHKKKLIVQCAHSAIEILQLSIPGKKVMDGSSFKNGYRPEPGECFGEIPEHIEK
jgi:methionyl-tRNA formyltransferase